MCNVSTNVEQHHHHLNRFSCRLPCNDLAGKNLIWKGNKIFKERVLAVGCWLCLGTSFFLVTGNILVIADGNEAHRYKLRRCTTRSRYKSYQFFFGAMLQQLKEFEPPALSIHFSHVMHSIIQLFSQFPSYGVVRYKELKFFDTKKRNYKIVPHFTKRHFHVRGRERERCDEKNERKAKAIQFYHTYYMRNCGYLCLTLPFFFEAKARKK